MDVQHFVRIILDFPVVGFGHLTRMRCFDPKLVFFEVK